jgi:hypothetical protein
MSRNSMLNQPSAKFKPLMYFSHHDLIQTSELGALRRVKACRAFVRRSATLATLWRVAAKDNSSDSRHLPGSELNQLLIDQ